MAKRTWAFLPMSGWGWWSIGLIVVMPVLFFLGMSFTDSLYAAVPAGGTLLKDIAARPALALSMLAGFGAGIAALVTGLLGILQKKERGLLVYVSSLIGALVVLYLAAELLFPH
jgi:hypothetical protein